MNRERWRAITEVFHAALARRTSSRASYVVDVCGEDEALRGDVEALLAAHDDAAAFGGIVPPASLRQLESGTQLGPYRIDGFLGAGGMGEVYRATDTRLDRTVAIKILASRLRLSADPQARFEREAHAISQLTHPHICTLYDIGREQDVDFFVMEYLEGRTLASHLSRGALAIDEALQIGIEIASALEHAHRHGIVHRDLKPGNVMLTRTGTKLLDFGLAKMGHPVNVRPGSLATMPARDTPASTLLGTLPYMAPEQLAGKEADARTDIWALGCVLFEMVSGTPAFPADTAASVIAAILGAPHDFLRRVQAFSLPSLEHVVTTCLEHDPDDRWQSAADVKRQLMWISTTSERETQPRSAQWVRWSSLAAALALAAVAGAGAGVLALRGTTAVDKTVTRALLDVAPADEVNGNGRLEFLPSIAGSRTAFSWLPNGRALVFVGRRNGSQQLYVLPLDGEARSLAGTENAQVPVVSDDGQWVAFWANGRVKKVPISGGTPTTFLERIPIPVGMAWCSNGDLLYTARSTIWAVSQAGEPRALTKLLPNEFAHILPACLPGNDAFIYTVRKRVESWGGDELVAQTRETGERKVLLRDAVDARYVDGHLLFMRLGSLCAVSFDLPTLATYGPPVAMESVAQALTGNSPGITGAGQFAVSHDGSLAYIRAGILPYRNNELVTVDRSGRVTPLSQPPHPYTVDVRLSPDGHRLAVQTLGISEHPLWIVDLRRAVATKLTPRGDAEWFVWTRDGRHLAFEWVDEGARQFAWQLADGSGTPERLSESFSPNAATPDGRRIVGVKDDDLWEVTLDRERPTMRPVLQTPAREGYPDVSPNGSWLTYASNTSGRMEVYVQPYSGTGGHTQVSIGGGTSPAWHPSGKELFFLAPTPDVMRVAMMVSDMSDGTPIGKPRQLFEFKITELGFSCVPNRCYDVAPDGEHFFTTVLSPAAERPVTQINLVLNWMHAVKTRTEQWAGASASVGQR